MSPRWLKSSRRKDSSAGKVETFVYLSHFHGISVSFQIYFFQVARNSAALLWQDLFHELHFYLYKWNSYVYLYLLYKVIVNVYGETL